MYFIDSAEKCFLSLDACKELKIVHKQFPDQIGEPGTLEDSQAHGSGDARRTTVGANSWVTGVNPLTESARPGNDLDTERGAKQQNTNTERPHITIPLTEENIERLEEWLMQQFSSTTFNVNEDTLPIMEGKPHHIHLKEDAIPYACHMRRTGRQTLGA